MLADLVIRGGEVVTPRGVIRADVAVADGLIAAIAPDLPGAAREIDARGLTVFPGLIDVHVHFNEPGRTDWEGCQTGSRALAAGGGTLFFDMPLNSTPCTVDSTAFDEKRALLEQGSIADFALWGGLVPGNRDALGGLAEKGVIGFKAFMADSGLAEFPRADDLTLYEGMREAAKLNLPVAVHAESEEITRGLAERLRPGGVREFLASRPVIAEVEAIARAAVLAGEAGAKLHIVHVSSGRGVVAAVEARARGVDLTIETCPHYLFFTEDDILRIGALAKCAPPLRDASERESLRSALTNGVVDIVASDHSPCPPAMKLVAQQDDFFRVWGGIAGVQSTRSVLLYLGLPVEHIARLTSKNPARRFGIVNKGELREGSDADIAIVDVAASCSQELFQRHPMSPYIGSGLKGRIMHTIRRGETIFTEGKITAQSAGRFVRPARTPHA